VTDSDAGVDSTTGTEGGVEVVGKGSGENASEDEGGEGGGGAIEDEVG